MSSSEPQRIAFIGFGEVGQTFARALAARGSVWLSAHDVLFGHPRGERLAGAAAALGVARHLSLPEALTGAAIVFSCVTASATEDVARSAAASIEQGQLYVDVNSAAPGTKRRAAEAIEAAGGRYLEAAVMAPVLKPGLQVPILAGGPHAAQEAERLNALGMNLTPVSEHFGHASAMKLCRSIVIKGLEALMVDCAAACDAAGVRDPVFASLAGTFPSIDWQVTAEAMKERVTTHGLRRAAEMREAGDMLQELGLNPALALAVADAQERGARERWKDTP
jgi:3-hydroxyisobutyrate dehydrogenase-like beta-hydroxyacid dehydrogenase